MTRARLLHAAMCVAVLSCGTATNATDPDAGARLSVFIPQEGVTLAHQQSSGIPTRERTVVRDAGEWPAMWARIHDSLEPPPDVVQPDFGEEMAVVAAMGTQNSGGHDIVIDSVARHERGTVVYVTEVRPGQACMTTGALTAPVHAVRAPRTDGSIWWRERSVVENC